MGNELTIPDNAIQKYDSDVFNDISKSGDFLPRVQLFGGNSDAVKKEQIPLGVWGLVKDAEHIDNLGKEFTCVPLLWRPKAMRITPDGTPLNYYDHKDAEFQKVKEQSFVKESKCMYGPEFLVWLDKGTDGQGCFATMFFNSKTMRREAPNVEPLMGKKVLFKIKLIETQQYTWHGPVTLADDTPLVSKPDPEEMASVIEKFNNPPKMEIEKEKTTDTRAR